MGTAVIIGNFEVIDEVIGYVHSLEDSGYNVIVIPNFKEIFTNDKNAILRILEHAEYVYMDVDDPDEPTIDLIDYLENNQINFASKKEFRRCPTVTIIGSMKFMSEIIEEYHNFEDKLYMAFLPNMITREMTEDEIRDVHVIMNRKIDMSSMVYVVNPGGYVGKDTAREIRYAEERDIAVVYKYDASGALLEHQL